MSKQKEGHRAQKRPWTKFKAKYLEIVFTCRNVVRYRVMGRGSYAWTSVTAGLLLSLFIYFTNFQSYVHITAPQDPSSFFITAGSMAGAMLAIVFAFSTVLASRSADALPKSLYKVFSRDKWLDIIYIIISGLTISLFADSFLVGSGVHYFRVGLIEIVWTLISVYWSYRRLISTLSHEYLITRLVVQARDEIEELQRIVRQKAKLLKVLNVHAGKEEVLSFESRIYAQLTSRVEGLLNYVSDLTTLYFGYTNKGDLNAANDCITTAMTIMTAYLVSRKDNSQLLLDQDFPLSPKSELNSFIYRGSEIITPIWQYSLKNDDLDGIRNFLTLYKNVIIAASQVKHLQDPQQNPAFTTAYFLLSGFISKSVSLHNTEAQFQAARILEQIAYKIVSEPPLRMGADGLTLVIDDLRKLLNAGLITVKDEPVASNTLEAILNICRAIFAQKTIPQHRYESIKNGLIESLTLYSALGSPLAFDSNYQITLFADQIVSIATVDFKKKLTENQFEKFLLTADLILSILEVVLPLSKGHMSSTTEFERSLVQFVKIMLSMEVSEIQKRRMARIWTRLLNLPGKYPLQKIENESIDDYDNLIDYICQIALYALDIDNDDNAKDIFDSIVKTLDVLLAKPTLTRRIYTFIRIGNKVKCIGALALARNKIQLATHIAKSIRDLEKRYLVTVFPNGYEANTRYMPSPEALRPNKEDLMSLSIRSGLPEYYQDAASLVEEMAGMEALDHFEAFIWP